MYIFDRLMSFGNGRKRSLYQNVQCFTGNAYPHLSNLIDELHFVTFSRLIGESHYLNLLNVNKEIEVPRNVRNSSSPET